MPRYVTPRREGQMNRRDPRPFKPMRPGGFSPLDLPVWAAAIVAAAWLPRHLHSLVEVLGALAALGVVGGVTVSMIKLQIHRRRSRPMVGPADQPFS